MGFWRENTCYVFATIWRKRNKPACAWLVSQTNRSQLDATHVSCSKHRSAKQTCSYRKKIYKVVLRPKSTPSETIGLSSHVQKNQITQTATSRSHKSNLKVTKRQSTYFGSFVAKFALYGMRKVSFTSISVLYVVYLGYLLII